VKKDSMLDPDWMDSLYSIPIIDPSPYIHHREKILSNNILSWILIY